MAILAPLLLAHAVAAASPRVPDGMLLGEPAVLSRSGTSPAAAFDGDGYVVAWIDQADPARPSLVAMRLSRSGKPLGAPPVRLATPATFPGAPAVAIGSGTTLVAWLERDALVGVRLDGAPQVVGGSELRVRAEPGALRLAYDGERFIVAGRGWPRALRLGQGEPPDRRAVPLAGGDAKARADTSAVACGAGRCLFVYVDHLANGASAAGASILHADRLGPARALRGNPYDVDAAAGPGLAAVMTTYSVVYGVQLGPGGEAAAEFTFARVPSGKRFDMRGPRVAGDGSGYLASWVEEALSGPVAVGLAYASGRPNAPDPPSARIPGEVEAVPVAGPEGEFLLLTSRKVRPGGPSEILARRVTLDRARLLKPVPKVVREVARGTVRSSGGAPVAAMVHYHVLLADGREQSGGRQASRDGAFTIAIDPADDGTPAAPVAAAVLWARNGAEISKALAPARFPAEVKLRLSPAAALDARCVGEGGAAAGPCTLRTEVAAPTSTPLDSETLSDPERTSADGTFTAIPLAAGEMLAMARTDDGRSGIARATTEPGVRRKLDVPVGPPGSLALRVVNGRGEPWPDELFLWLDPGAWQDESPQVVALQPGETFEAEELLPGPQRLVVTGRGRMPMVVPVDVAPGRRTDLGAVAFGVPVPPGKVGVVLGRDEEGAIVVERLAPGSPAEAGGVEPGDVVRAVDGVRPRSAEDAKELLGGAAGTPVRLTVFRDGVGDLELRVTRQGERGAAGAGR